MYSLDLYLIYWVPKNPSKPLVRENANARLRKPVRPAVSEVYRFKGNRMNLNSISEHASALDYLSG